MRRSGKIVLILAAVLCITAVIVVIVGQYNAKSSDIANFDNVADTANEEMKSTEATSNSSHETDVPAVSEPAGPDYAVLFGNYLDEIKYGEGCDWKHAALVDLDQDNIPELFASYGNNHTLYYSTDYFESDYFEVDQSSFLTGSVDIFKYVDGKIVEITPDDPDILDKIELSTDYSLMGARGQRHKQIYCKTIDSRNYICIFEEYADAHNMLIEFVAYSINESGKLSKNIRLHKAWQDWDPERKETEYIYQGEEIDEKEFEDLLNKFRPDQGSFLIREDGSDGQDTEGNIIYQIDAENCKFF